MLKQKGQIIFGIRDGGWHGIKTKMSLVQLRLNGKYCEDNMSDLVKNTRISDLKNILDQFYEKCNFNGITCYKNANGLIFDIDCFSIVENDPAYVAEYKDEFEDGSRYYISDYNSLEDLAKDMMKEIDKEMPVR